MGMPKKTELSDQDKALRTRLGAAIRDGAIARGLRPQDIAKVTGVSLAHQYRIEGGETTPDAIYLYKVAAHFGVPVDHLFSGEVTPKTAGVQVQVQVHGQGHHVVGHVGGDLTIGATTAPVKRARAARKTAETK